MESADKPREKAASAQPVESDRALADADCLDWPGRVAASASAVQLDRAPADAGSLN